VLERTLEERMRDIVFAHEPVAELVGDGKDTTGTNGVDEEGVGAVERVDVPPPP
jgi:hypothetical protein